METISGLSSPNSNSKAEMAAMSGGRSVKAISESECIMDKSVKETVSNEENRQPETAVLENEQLRLTLCDYGAAVYNVEVKKPDGKTQEIVLGRDTPLSFAENPNYYGATVGRVANRIGNAEFELNGRKYQLPVNDGKNHLHGGIHGLTFRTWKMEEKGQLDE